MKAPVEVITSPAASPKVTLPLNVALPVTANVLEAVKGPVTATPLVLVNLIPSLSNKVKDEDPLVKLPLISKPSVSLTKTG